MKQFFKFMFASMLGFIITLVIIFFIFMAIIMAMLSFAKTEEVVVNDPSLLHMKLNYEIGDRTSNNPMQAMLTFDSFKSVPGLNDILRNIEKAKRDDNIKGIYLDLIDLPSNLASIGEIREAILDFRESGKFVYVYSEMLSQKAYYLASAADKIFLSPEGLVELRGFRGEVMFIKGTLEKLDIEAQIIRHGKFKSAIEPLIREDMSEANKEQTSAFIQSMWNNVSMDISKSRNIPIAELNTLSDNLTGLDPDEALSSHLIDSLIYMDQFLDLLATKLDIEKVAASNLISSSKYMNAKVPVDKKRSKNKVALIYAEGNIMQGEGNDNAIGSDNLARTIRNARLDDHVKAVVLRVNSPGGDGIASDVILREVVKTQEVKPVVVSMGNYAASGGYYIACGAEKIVANPGTLTGSIGVFGLIPNFEKFFHNKLGITFDGVKTNENADYLQVNKPLTDFQKQLLQQQIDRFYDTFVNHVAKGRGMTYEEVDAIAQGRVWTGSDALENGLIDQLGGMKDAIDLAVELAQIEDYRVIDLPKQKEPFQQIFDDLFGEMRMKILQQEIGEYYNYYQTVQYLKNADGIQARLPFDLEIN
ncbi:MAG: signal peptide peptidase SppA [Bacteroidales bacterium]|nr:signal peptide peptidase SppA [Bacteroidales bacterium]MCF8405074.1 signal peptide peptidase SppA [Bacteroidales bacterium]